MLSASTGKQRIAHKPNSKPKVDAVLDLEEEDEENEGEDRDGTGIKSVMTKEELWARLDELEKLEELQDERDRYMNTLCETVESYNCTCEYFKCLCLFFFLQII